MAVEAETCTHCFTYGAMGQTSVYCAHDVKKVVHNPVVSTAQKQNALCSLQAGDKAVHSCSDHCYVVTLVGRFLAEFLVCNQQPPPSASGAQLHKCRR